MRVDSDRLRKMFTEELSESVILVFEKKKWAGTLLRLSFKVLTSPLRIETVPEWVDDEPPPQRTVSQIARELLSHFQAPLYCSETIELVDTTCFSDEEWKTAMLKFARVLQNAELEEVYKPLCFFLHYLPAPIMSSYFKVSFVHFRPVWHYVRPSQFCFCIKTNLLQVFLQRCLNPTNRKSIGLLGRRFWLTTNYPVQ